MEEEGEVHYIFRMSVVRNQKEKLLLIDQNGLLSSALNRFGMEDCKPVTTLLEPEAKFGKLNGNVVDVKLYTEY